MQIIQGDLLKLADAGRFDVIVHGCNCFCSMDAGIARAIANKWPEAYEADRATSVGDRTKLGTFTTATVTTQAGTELTVVNAYTQFDYRGPGPKIDYGALEAAFRRLADAFPEARIGYPKIGAGLAGGDWSRIAAIIDDALGGLDHTLVEYMPS
jgi:O-acetyl-ADP-ribose deacetylase (regulator of RNase III)